MNFLIIGTDDNLNECRAKFGDGHDYQRTDHTHAAAQLKPDSVVFDFDPRDVSIYRQKGQIVFLNSCKKTLTRLTSRSETEALLIGFCGLPTFLNREILEAVVRSDQRAALEKIASELNTKYKIVEDRIGMVTPRIICMIINEAYFAIEENVASRTDIDLAMKLGTNYPFGPFEWSQKIGVRQVYELLKAVYADTGDERYRISGLLEREAG